MKRIHGRTLAALAAILALLATPAVMAQATGKGIVKTKDTGATANYIVVLEGDALPAYMASRPAISAQAAGAPGQPSRPDLKSVEALQYRLELDDRFAEFRQQASAALGRELQAKRRFHHALNGFTAELSEAEAKQLSKLPGVLQVQRDYIIRKQTYAGPEWIGAREIWDGLGGLPESRGEGVVVGIIDSGANWEHVSFADPSSGVLGHDHVNPYPQQLGLCSEPEVECNDKLVGVYDFVEDLPNTEVVEEFNNGRDNGQHGAHVASTVAGNPVQVGLFGSVVPLSGVAPNANIISYRVCFEGDPEDFEDDGCVNSQIVTGIEQAIEDQVDVINMSLGGGQFPSWGDPLALAYLNAYQAGIFVATSASNNGPDDGSILNPANAPWLLAVGSATHNRIFGTTLTTVSGGDTPPPGALKGASSTTQALTSRKIVYAKDFGNALCGVGDAELANSCAGNTGSTNPFEPGTFNGEIVVCDRGIYGRVEKGKNVLLAGAGGFVLANTDATGESINVDQHCLPATHLGDTDGDKLRAWLDSGENHEAFLSSTSAISGDQFADRLSSFSSRGPNLAPAEDILKPNVIAPGDLIWAASNEGSNQFVGLGGTSMSSPHAAGAAALLKSIRPSWTPAMISSALQLTATDELATDENGVPATRLEVGHGRIRVGEAAKAGLYLNETGVRFANAGPGGSVAPRDLNLPSMTDASCAVQCSFKRTLRPLVAGKTWMATVTGFPAGVEVTVTPQQFTLAQGAQQQITVDVDLTNLGQLGGWLSGDVVLSASGVPDAVMPVTVQAVTGELPALWEITSNTDAGSVSFGLNGLPALPQATFTAGGLSEPELTEQALAEDPTFLEPYDNDEGTYTIWLDVPPGSLLLYAGLTAPAGALEGLDLDLFVGYDSDRDGRADAFEEECASQGSSFDEQCTISAPTSGDWWVRVQNWENGVDPNSTDGDLSATELTTAVISGSSDAPLSASGPGTTALGENFELKLAWDNVSARGGQTLAGAVGVGSSQDSGSDIGVIPVIFRRTGIAAPVTTVLHPGRHTAFALTGGDIHDKLFVDVPPGVNSLTVSAEGGTNTQSNNLKLEVYRRSFDNAFGSAPLAAPLPGGSPVATAMGGGGNGPSLTLSGPSLAQGRWYAVVTNTGGSSASVRVETEFGYAGSPPLMRADLWQSASRADIGQGLQYIELGANRAVAWYTYDDDGLPTWYLAAGAGPEGNSWSADVQRFTNDGDEQQSNVVGRLTATMLADDDMVFSWTLFGQSGSERMEPSFSDTSCPDIGDGPKNYSGIWTRVPEGKGGASIAMNGNVQAQTHYIYDDQGNPRWLLAPALIGTDTISLSQFSGFCPNCSGSISDQPVGTVTRDFESEDSGGWTLDYLLEAPLSANVQRTDVAQRLSSSAACQ